MKIAINTRLLISGKMDGIGWFTLESVRRIVTAHPEHQFYFLFDRKPSPEFLFSPNVHPLVLCPQARHPILWYLFFEWSVPRILKRHHIDLFLSTDGLMSLRTNVPTLDVIHDLNFEHTTDNLRPSHQRYMTHYFPRFAKKATRIATVSQYSKDDIASTYGIPQDKIDVVYDGSHQYYQPWNEEVNQSTRNQYANGNPYFIFVSTILRRKNLTNTLLAFDQYKSTHSDSTKLIVVGNRVWWQDELKEAYDQMTHQSDVILLGRMPSEELSKLMSAALSLVYISYFEGFGIPILEAFYSDTPVITSNCTSMPEVAGEAAILVDPHNVNQVAEAMHTMATDANLRQQLIQKSRIQRQKYSWDNTANLLWQSLMQTYQDSCEK